MDMYTRALLTLSYLANRPNVVRTRFACHRLFGFPLSTPVQRAPWRSPAAVSDAIRDILAGKVVCELGCAEGDNLFFMKRYAKRVFGVELDEKRGMFARRRGLDIITGDWGQIPVPDADVYYFWPDDTSHCFFLVDRILNQRERGVIVAAGDTGWPTEPPVIQHCARLGRLAIVPFNEGRGWRKHGEFMLAIIDIAEGRRIREQTEWTAHLPADLRY